MNRSEWLEAYRVWRVVRVEYARTIHRPTYEALRARVMALPPEVMRTNRWPDPLLRPLSLRMRLRA